MSWKQYIHCEIAQRLAWSQATYSPLTWRTNTVMKSFQTPLLGVRRTQSKPRRDCVNNGRQLSRWFCRATFLLSPSESSTRFSKLRRKKALYLFRPPTNAVRMRHCAAPRDSFRYVLAMTVSCRTSQLLKQVGKGA